MRVRCSRWRSVSVDGSRQAQERDSVQGRRAVRRDVDRFPILLAAMRGCRAVGHFCRRTWRRATAMIVSVVSEARWRSAEYRTCATPSKTGSCSRPRPGAASDRTSTRSHRRAAAGISARPSDRWWPNPRFVAPPPRRRGIKWSSAGAVKYPSSRRAAAYEARPERQYERPPPVTWRCSTPANTSRRKSLAVGRQARD